MRIPRRFLFLTIAGIFMFTVMMLFNIFNLKETALNHTETEDTIEEANEENSSSSNFLSEDSYYPENQEENSESEQSSEQNYSDNFEEDPTDSTSYNQEEKIKENLRQINNSTETKKHEELDEEIKEDSEQRPEEVPRDVISEYKKSTKEEEESEITTHNFSNNETSFKENIENESENPENQTQNNEKYFKNKTDYSSHLEEFWPLYKEPNIPELDSIACRPKKFGYTESQALETFPPKKLGSCRPENRNSVYEKNNFLIVNCTDNKSSYYSLGSKPKEELYGLIKESLTWTPYNRPIPLEEREFAFGKCGEEKETPILINKFNKASAERAKNLTEQNALYYELKSPPRPLTVLMIMFDSVSRNHFYRNFLQTVDFLNSSFAIEGEFGKDMEIFDFVLNNAHGKNTIKNMPYIIYGNKKIYENTEKLKVNKNSDHPVYKNLQEDAIWKVFERKGFVTMFGFDTNLDSISTVTGRKIYTDHIATNFWHAAKSLYNYNEQSTEIRCFGSKNSHWFALDYMKQFVKNYEGFNRFGYIHSLPGHEETGNVIKSADLDCKEFLKDLLRFFQKRPEEDFVILFGSDHGIRLREWDMSIEGVLEHFLPYQLLISNKSFLESLGDNTKEILLHNTKRLVSRYDWHITLQHLSYAPYVKLESQSEEYSAIKKKTETSNTLSLLLEEIPDERKCKDTEIKENFCSCYEFVEMSVQEAIEIDAIKKLMKLAELKIINMIDSYKDFCEEVTFRELSLVKFREIKEHKVRSRILYIVRFEIQEEVSVMFEAFGILSTESVIKSESQKLIPGYYPKANSEYEGYEGKEEIVIQVQEVSRLDTYRGVCEEISKIIGSPAPFCVCKKPKNLIMSNLNSYQIEVIEKLKQSLTVFIGAQGENCENTCRTEDFMCEDWGYDVLNSYDSLNEDYREDNSYKITSLKKKQIEFKDLGVKKVVEGETLGILEGNEENYLVVVEEGINCTSMQKLVYPICPCLNKNYKDPTLDY